jgi:hypothetical protein
MISVTLTRGLADARLKVNHRLALAWLHSVLSWSDYRAVKVMSLRNGIRCSRSDAFKALALLEQLGYLEAHPAQRKPKHYRLANPASLPQETSQVA